MHADSRRILNLHELRNYVNQTICDKEQLEPGAFQMTERLLIRGSRPCGMLFCLHGPRAVRFTAVWETETNTVLFYGSSGERFLQTRLAAAPPLEGSRSEKASAQAA